VGAFAQALAAPVALVALPVTALLLLVGRGRRARIAAAAAAVPAVAWLVSPGELPDQVMRAAALLAAAVFGIVSTRPTVRFTHRALLALGAAAAGIAVAFLAFGWSWDRLHWWVGFRAGAALRLLLTASAPSGAGTAPGNLDRPDFEAMLSGLVRTSADLYPAALALELLLGLALAVALAPRLAGVPVGRPLGRFADFRFSEHLGWLLVLALVLVVVPGLGPARPAALNVLVVMAVLYGLRGCAVVFSALRAVRAGPILYAAAVLAVFFMMPGTVLLGVLDAGLNLRRRRPPPSGA
jgi:hypothetical protein